MPFFRPFQGMLDPAIQLLAQTPVVALDFFARRPIRRRVRGQSSVHRINAKRKQVNRTSAGTTATRRRVAPANSNRTLQRAHVENNAVSFGNRSVYMASSRNHTKDLIRARTCVY